MLVPASCADASRSAMRALLLVALIVAPEPAACQQTGGVSPPAVSVSRADTADRRGRDDLLPDPGSSGLPRFETSDLLYAGVLAGSFAAIWPLQEIEESLRPDEPPSGAADVFYTAGATLGSLVVLGGLSAAALGVGTVADRPGLARLGLHSLEALLVAEIVVQPLKLAVGRRRPIEDEATSTEFDPFRFDSEYQSFPSGHTAQAFAVASVLSSELGDVSPWVPWVSYPVAGLIGASRIVGQKHWVTDVVAGAAVGLFAGHFVERWNHPPEDGSRLTIRPVFAAGTRSFYAGLDIRLP